MRKIKEQKQEDLDNAKFLTKPEEKALGYYLEYHRQISFIKKHYPSLLVKL